MHKHRAMELNRLHKVKYKMEWHVSSNEDEGLRGKRNVYISWVNVMVTETLSTFFQKTDFILASKNVSRKKKTFNFQTDLLRNNMNDI